MITPDTWKAICETEYLTAPVYFPYWADKYYIRFKIKPLIKSHIFNLNFLDKAYEKNSYAKESNDNLEMANYYLYGLKEYDIKKFNIFYDAELLKNKNYLSKLGKKDESYKDMYYHFMNVQNDMSYAFEYFKIKVFIECKISKNIMKALYFAYAAELTGEIKGNKLRKEIEKGCSDIQIKTILKKLDQAGLTGEININNDSDTINENNEEQESEITENKVIEEQNKDDAYKPTFFVIYGLFIIKALSAFLHIFTVYQIYTTLTSTAGIISFFLPIISQTYWAYYNWINSGEIFNSYNQILFTYLISVLIIWTFVFISTSFSKNKNN